MQNTFVEFYNAWKDFDTDETSKMETVGREKCIVQGKGNQQGEIGADPDFILSN